MSRVGVIDPIRPPQVILVTANVVDGCGGGKGWARNIEATALSETYKWCAVTVAGEVAYQAYKTSVRARQQVRIQEETVENEEQRIDPRILRSEVAEQQIVEGVKSIGLSATAIYIIEHVCAGLDIAKPVLLLGRVYIRPLYLASCLAVPIYCLIQLLWAIPGVKRWVKDNIRWVKENIRWYIPEWLRKCIFRSQETQEGQNENANAIVNQAELEADEWDKFSIALENFHSSLIGMVTSMACGFVVTRWELSIAEAALTAFFFGIGRGVVECAIYAPKPLSDEEIVVLLNKQRAAEAERRRREQEQQQQPIEIPMDEFGHEHPD